jgi:rsbT antagonist protein RsbS
MVQVPIVKLDGVLLITIQDELLDYSVDELQQQITEQVVAQQARGVLIDISVLDVVDSFLARTLHDIAAVTSLLAAKTVVVGMRPAVAITLVELGLVLPGLQTALSVEDALARMHGGDGPLRAAHR